MAEDLSKYLDENGYPGTRQYDGTWDGGDTAAILGTLWFFGQMLDKNLPTRLVKMKGFIPVRHPDYSKWYGQTDRFSRDQLIAVLCGLQQRHNGRFLYRAHKNRYFLTAWNTRKNGAMDTPKKWPDFTGPEVWALWLRIFKPWWARLVLPILDLELMVGAVHWRWFRKDRVTRNHMLSLLACNRTLPTVTSRLAYWIANFEDLINRWDAHCKDCGEYPTADLFREYIKSGVPL